MSKSSLQLILLLIAVVVAFEAEDRPALSTENYGLLLTGNFHGSEIQVDSGSVWFALVKNDSGTCLKRVTLDVKRTRDHMFDNAEEETGKVVSVPIPERPIYLLKGPGLADGPVESCLSGGKFVYPGESLSLKLGDSYFFFRAYGEAFHQNRLGEETAIRNYTLEYKGWRWPHNHYQSILSWSQVSMDGRPWIMWAGDLNRDGFLDIIMNLGGHEGVLSLTLFMSTSKGDSLENVASFKLGPD